MNFLFLSYIVVAPLWQPTYCDRCLVVFYVKYYSARKAYANTKFVRYSGFYSIIQTGRLQKRQSRFSPVEVTSFGYEKPYWQQICLYSHVTVSRIRYVCNMEIARAGS